MAAHWDAERYDARHAFVWEKAADLIDLLRPLPGERVLDLGCGTGHLTARLAAAGADVLGIDASPAMIARARQAHPGLRFEVADARDFHAAEPFDAVFSNAALHWVKEAGRAADSVRRALRPGGRFVAEFGGRGNVRAVRAALAAAAEGLAPGPLPDPWYFPGVGEYALLLEQNGLEVTFATLFDRPTPLGEEGGLRAWVEMFGADFLVAVGPGGREEFLRRVEEQARPRLFRDGTWLIDYRRLRVVAWRLADG